MKIHEKFKTEHPLLSFELFPPKRNSDAITLYRSMGALADLNPDFISITYGAAGSERGRATLDIAAHIKKYYGIDPLAHLTSAGASEAQIDEILDIFESEGIENVMALRGDLTPEDLEAGSRDFPYAEDLIRHIRSKRQLSIGGACYPEGHVDSPSRTLDLIHLKDKVDAGANFLVTQLFFDNAAFYDFKREVRSLGIDVPILTGIMPVLNKKQIERIVQLSGASFPEKFKRIIDRYENKPEALADAGIAYACEQIVDLLSSGSDGIHIYVMNKPEVAQRIVGNIGGILKVLRAESKETPKAE
jgi:methylenetetrahydrofolate reductase (NADPH)